MDNYTDPNFSSLSIPYKTSESLATYMALEYFLHPTIRFYLSKIYYQHVVLHTKPTELGKSMTVYD